MDLNKFFSDFDKSFFLGFLAADLDLIRSIHPLFQVGSDSLYNLIGVRVFIIGFLVGVID